MMNSKVCVVTTFLKSAESKKMYKVTPFYCKVEQM